jgi:hypothetical protein
MTLLDRKSAAKEAERPDWPVGWDDETSDFYVEPELRVHYQRDPATDRGWLRNLASIPIPVRLNGYTRMVEPNRGGRDEELWLHAKAIEAAGQAIVSDRVRAEQDARDEREYRCAACRLVVTPGMSDAGAWIRRIRVGVRDVDARLCGGCWSAVARRAVDAEPLPDGRTRGQAADELLAGLRSTKGKAS